MKNLKMNNFLWICYFSFGFILNILAVKVMDYQYQLQKTIKNYEHQLSIQETNTRASLVNIAESLFEKDKKLLHTGGKLSREALFSSHEILEAMNNTINVDQFVINFNTYIKERKGFKSNLPLDWPVSYDIHNAITSFFGMRVRNGISEWHGGLDIISVYNSNILSTCDGKVIYTNNDHPLYGKCIEIKHKYGFSTFYAHLKRIKVRKGRYYKKGYKIGIMGSSGDSDGIHLHYEIRLFGRQIDPIKFLNFF